MPGTIFYKQSSGALELRSGPGQRSTESWVPRGTRHHAAWAEDHRGGAPRGVGGASQGRGTAGAGAPPGVGGASHGGPPRGVGGASQGRGTRSVAGEAGPGYQKREVSGLCRHQGTPKVLMRPTPTKAVSSGQGGPARLSEAPWPTASLTQRLACGCAFAVGVSMRVLH